MTGEFHDKIVLVTGGTGNVGRLIVEGLARGEAHVLINCFHSFAEAKELAAVLRADGLAADVYRASVAKPAQVEQMFSDIRRDHGRLDILINNAAAGAFVNLPDVTEEMLDRIFATNVKGALWCARQARVLMPRGGVIVNVSSLGAGSVVGDYLPTGITKAALESLTRYLAAELAIDGIRVNTASAGALDNPIISMFPNPDRLAANVLNATPLRRLGTSQDLADVVLALASDRMGFVTGQTLLADGGVSLNSTVLTGAAPLPTPLQGAPSPSEAASAASGPPSPTSETPADMPELQTVVARASLPESPAPGAVAVVGMGVVVPGASSPDEFWKLLTSGELIFGEPPPDRWRTADFISTDPAAEDKSYQVMGGFIRAPRDNSADYSQGWLRQCLHRAMDGVRRDNRDRVRCYLGYTSDVSQHQEEATVLEELRAAGLDERGQHALIAKRFAHLGESQQYLAHRIARDVISGILPDDTRTYLIDTACSSSLYAIDLGAREILAGTADMVVCGGGGTLTPTQMVLFSRNRGLSPSGVTRPLDADTDGVVFGEGAGIIVLKQLSRAVADGDQILGVLAGSGLSSDGKGNAVYAPSTAGQVLAIRRALRNVPTEAVDLVLAHATGTPAGDPAELAGIRQCYPHPLSVLANKSLIGHSGWAAGVVSVIHLLLALRHSTIPPQHHFETPSPDLGHLKVPTTPMPWPAQPGRPRVGAVSSFGFGGTNAHLLVQDYHPDTTVYSAPGPTLDDELVLVGSACRRPNGDSFGPNYPLPPLTQLRLPAAVVRRQDRTQLMLVECMHQLDPAVRDACQRRKDRVGAIVGHHGPTRNSVLYRCRVHLDDIDHAAVGEPGLAEFLRTFRRQVTSSVPASSEDSFPGVLPNILAGRLANYFDLQGLNLTVDLGEASLIGAFEVAAHYLRFGDIDIALVGAANGNTLPSWRAMLGETRLAEAAYLFAVTTRTIAEQESLPILAFFDTDEAEHSILPHRGPTDGHVNFGGAEGGAELIGFLTGDAPAINISRRPGPELPVHTMRLQRHTHSPAPSPAPDDHTSIDRYVLSLTAHPSPLRADHPPIIPPDSVVLTNNAATLAGFDLPAGTHIVLVGDTDQFTDSDDLLDDHRPRHLRLIADLSASKDGVLRLHEAMFVAVRTASAWLDADGSVVTYVLGGIDSDRSLHPLCGLFTGFTKALLSELPETVAVRAVVHESTDLSTAAVDVATEPYHPNPSPVCYYAAGQRLIMRAIPAPNTAGTLPLTRDSVVLAAGGARGIGAEILKALAREVQPRIVVLGTTTLSDETDAGDRKSFILARTRGPAAISVRAADAEYTRIENARRVGDTLASLTAQCGPNRVTYLTCDLRDPGEVERAVDHVLEAIGPVDLLLNIAGISRTAALTAKTLDDFVAVRDTKVRTYLNLHAAFAGRRPIIWCNFSSVAGVATLPGEVDYCAANDFLYSAASHTNAQSPNGRTEFTIGWSWWAEAGFAADHLRRSYLNSRLTPMTTHEGVRRFLTELADPTRAHSIVHLGARERATLDRITPDCQDNTAAATAASAVLQPPQTSFYIDNIEQHTADTLIATRVLDSERDSYLQHHQVSGIPTMPGFFFIEAAANATAHLLDGQIPAVFENLQLTSFLRVYGPDRPRPIRITARKHTRPDDQPVIHVRITGDVIAPNGRRLVHDRLFASVDVLPGNPPPAPHWPGNDGPTEHVTNPYYTSNPILQLTGPFVSTSQWSCHPDSRRARLDLDPAAITQWFADTTTPIVTLDGMAQLAMVQKDPEPPTSLPVPDSVERITLHRATTDSSLANSTAAINLIGTPRNLNPDTRWLPNQTIAIDTDGHVIATITNLAGITPQPGQPIPAAQSTPKHSSATH